MLIVGDGGHAKVVREVIKLYGGDEWPGDFVFIAVGNNRDRAKEVRLCGDKTFFATLIHPSAVISPSATIGHGTIVMAGVVVQAGAMIGTHCILNSGCSVDHDCVLGDFVHVAPGARLCGGVRVGDGALIGVCVGIEPVAEIPAWSIVKRGNYEIAIRGNG